MTPTEFSALSTLLIAGFGGVAFVLTTRSIDKRIDRLEKHVNEMAAQVSAITNAIVASRS